MQITKGLLCELSKRCSHKQLLLPSVSAVEGALEFGPGNCLLSQMFKIVYKSDLSVKVMGNGPA